MFSDQQFIDSLGNHLNYIGDIVKKLGCSRQTARKRLRKLAEEKKIRQIKMNYCVAYIPNKGEKNVNEN